MLVNVLYQPSRVHRMRASEVAVVRILHWGAKVAEAPSLQCVDAGIHTYVCTQVLGGYVCPRWTTTNVSDTFTQCACTCVDMGRLLLCLANQ